LFANLKDLANSLVINIKAIGNIWPILLIPTIIERGSRRVLVLKVALVLYKNPLINRRAIHIYLSDIKKISLITRFIQILFLIIYSSRV
jgi:hypothetical protein